MLKIKSLFLAANPVDTERLSLDKEVREISSKIRASEYRDSIELISVWAVRPDDLIQSLNEYKPQIVHFSGHGSSIGEIVLVDELGNVKPISPTALRALFATLKDNIRVVVLNACYSKIQSKAITEVIDCAIGMSTAITDDAAVTFIASFYRALGFGRSVQESFNQGKTAILLAGFPEENTPELLVKPGVDASKITLITGKETDENIKSKKLEKVSTKGDSQIVEPPKPLTYEEKEAEVAQPVQLFEKDKKRFLETLPGILTGLAAIITSIGGLLAFVIQLDMFTPNSSSLPTPTFTSSSAITNATVTPLPKPTDTGNEVNEEFLLPDGVHRFRNRANGRFLDIDPSNRDAILADGNGSGTRWLLTNHEGGTVSLQNLGNSAFKDFYMDIDGDTGEVTLSEGQFSGTYWKLSRVDGSFTFQNLGRTSFLDYYLDFDPNTGKVIVGQRLASGTHWETDR